MIRDSLLLFRGIAGAVPYDVGTLHPASVALTKFNYAPIFRRGCCYKFYGQPL